jgi:lipoate-protein ligase A
MKSDVDKVHVPIFTALDVYHDFTWRSAATNMAIDEALLEAVTIPSIRFYRWNSPALSFGYFGKFADVADYTVERDLVRRWTGGGIVFHGDDLTYAIVVPRTNYCFARSPRDFYFDVHAAIRQVFVEEGVNAVLADSIPLAIGDVCFANPVRGDVLVNGKKIAGAAQRRRRTALLQQGSIQHACLPHDFIAKLAEKLCPSVQTLRLPASFIDYAREIAGRRYETREWLHRR